MKLNFYSIFRKAGAALLLTAAGALPILADGTIPYRASFDNAQMRYSSKGEYSKMKSTEIATYGEIGAPGLPVRTYRFVVPVYTGKFTVSMTLPEKASETVLLEKPLMPRQPHKWNDELQEKLTVDSKAYNKVYTPKAWVVDDYFIDGSNHIVTVAVMPVEYNPMASTMKYYQYADIKLNYADVAANEMSSRPVFTKRPDRNLDLSKIAVNGESPKRISYPEFDGHDFFKGAYFIISPSAYISAFKELAEWKRSKGYYVIVQSVENILSNPAYANGDVISDINDDAGKLRMCLRDTFEQYGRSYVLLAGDYHTNFPIRYAHTPNMGSVTADVQSPTDVYFSDMTGNWDSNHNKQCGEIFIDSVNFYPDMFIGRLLCKNAQEVENYTRKLMLYERNPGIGDCSYLSKGFVTYSNDYPRLENGEHCYDAYVKNNFNSKYTSVTEMHSTNSGIRYKGSQVISEMNNGYGFNIIGAHGQPHMIAVSRISTYESYYICSLNSYKNINNDTNLGFDNLNDITKPSILFASACTTIPFDQYNDGPNGYYQEYTLGAAYTEAGLYGGVSYMGYTRSASSPEDSKYIGVFLNILENGSNIGDVFSTAKHQQLCDANADKYHIVNILRSSLIGDPEMNVWTQTPKKFNITIPASGEAGASFESLGIFGAKVIVSDGKKTTLQKTVPNNATTFSISDVSNKCVTFTKPGYLPQSFLFIDNSFINDARTYFMTSGTIKGVQIGNGGKVTIYASGNVILDGGFTVSCNGSLEIITDGNIMVNRGTLETRGAISLKARGEIRVSPGLNKAMGSFLNISYIR